MTPSSAGDQLISVRASELVRELTNAARSPGQLANDAAALAVLDDYRERLSPQSRRRHDADLGLFSRFLALAGLSIDAAALASSPPAWAGITWGIVAAFARWQLQEGYAVASVNARLSTVKRYAALACSAGGIDADEYTKMRQVRGYTPREARRLDDQREARRRGPKKAEAVSISGDQADALKDQPDTPQGRRDALMCCLLLDHGLRVGELAELQVTAVDLRAGTFTFYRSKVAKTQTHRMTLDTYRAAVAYFQQDAPAIGALLRGSTKRGELAGGMSARAITKRVRELGQRVGLTALSPHDCRHYWATAAIQGGTDIKSLQDAGGWASPAMPLRYAESAEIVNQGVKLAPKREQRDQKA